MSNVLTEFDEEVYREGLLEEGRHEAALDTASNLFKNGVSYDIVRHSIELLTDDELKAIYKEVTGKEIK